MVQAFWLKRVSRYKADRKQIKYHHIVILLTPLERSAYTTTDSLSRKQEQDAKTVTSLFTLLSVLAKVALIADLAGFVLKAEFSFFLSRSRNIAFKTV
jgi:hypothetical protein